MAAMSDCSSRRMSNDRSAYLRRCCSAIRAASIARRRRLCAPSTVLAVVRPMRRRRQEHTRASISTWPSNSPGRCTRPSAMLKHPPFAAWLLTALVRRLSAHRLGLLPAGHRDRRGGAVVHLADRGATVSTVEKRAVALMLLDASRRSSISMPLKSNANSVLIPLWAAAALVVPALVAGAQLLWGVLAGVSAGVAMLTKYWSMFPNRGDDRSPRSPIRDAATISVRRRPGLRSSPARRCWHPISLSLIAYKFRAYSPMPPPMHAARNLTMCSPRSSVISAALFYYRRRLHRAGVAARPECQGRGRHALAAGGGSPPDVDGDGHRAGAAGARSRSPWR